MDTNDWREVELDLETGICLWLGAGVSTHLSRSIGGRLPQWGELTEALERDAGVVVDPKFKDNFPERLQICTSELGTAAVRRKIARAVYAELCVQIAKFAYDNVDNLAMLPAAVIQLAALGWRANPIVNFNIETFSSMLAARPAGPCRILPYRSRDASTSSHYVAQESGSDFARIVYHPHGAANYSGNAVMTSSEYAAHDGSLAYLLSVSAAFENNLWIVGMSLDDLYLRNQLATHRNQINRIRWFNTKPELEKHAEWALKNDIKSVAVDWPAFWHRIEDSVEPQIRLSDAMSAWYYVIETALAELFDGTPREKLADLAARFPALSITLPESKSEGEYRRAFERSEAATLLPQDFSRRRITDNITTIVRNEVDFITTLIDQLNSNYGTAARDIVSALELAKPMRISMRHMNL
jgi:hypothetical protein